MYDENGRPVSVWCISHCDLDGHGAAAIVKQQYPEASVIITNYNKPIRLERIRPGDIVYVTDFSLSIDTFRMLENKKCRIIWIDHHISAIQELTAQGWNCEGIRNTEYSGTALTWMYFNPNKTFDQAPYFVKLINWYDLWQHDKDPNIRPFQYGVGLWDTRPGYFVGDRFWNDLYSNVNGDKLLQNIIRHGKLIQEYSVRYQKLLCKDLAYRTTLTNSTIGNRTIMAMATRAGNSSVFENMDLTGIDATFVGQFMAGQSNQFRCSMYSPDNVKPILDIVQQFGGGGHPTAAGFSSRQYPLNYPEPKAPIPLATIVEEYEQLRKLRVSSPILMKYADKSNGITSRVCGWQTTLDNKYKCLAFNCPYLPEMLHVMPTSVDCMDMTTGDIADLYVGFTMTNSGFFRCCACPTSSSVDMSQVLQDLQAIHMKQLTEHVYNFKLINGNVWWYAPEMPVSLPAVRIENTGYSSGK